MELVAHAASLSWKITDAYQNVPRQRGRCRAVVEQISSLGRLLSDMKPALPNPLTPQVKAYFELLNEALEKAYRLMEKTSKSSTIKYILTSKQIAEDLVSVSSDIEACLRGLPLIQLAQTTEIHDQVRGLQSSFGELGKQLEEQNVFTREQQDLAAEVLAILRTKNSTEQNSTRLISWLAEQFDADIQSVKSEFQEMKKNLNQLDHAESKKMVEAELLEQIVLCIDELETQKAMDSIDHAGVPGEFKCGICLGVMKRPVVISSGHSFCRVCIEENFRKGPATCPFSRAAVRPDLLFENVALRGAISRWWKQTNSGSMKEAGRNEPLLKRTYSTEAVEEMIKELESQNHIKLLRNLNFLLEVSSSADGPALIYKLGGVESLAKLMDSNNKKITEKVTTILAQLTKLSTSNSSEDGDSVQLQNDIFECCLDKLISLMSRGTGTTRLKAAATLANLLFIPEVIECLLSQPGIVSALASLSSESGDALEVCLKGLRMLSKNSDHSLAGNDSLVACLVDLLQSEEDYIVEEAVVALRSTLTSQACEVLRTKNALPSLVRWSTTSDGVMQEAAVVILETFVKHEGFDELVKAGFTRQISPLLSRSGLSENKVLFAGVLRLSKGCLDSQQDLSQELVSLQNSIPRLMSVLPVREYTSEVLALLKTICVKDSTCKELVLDTGGLQVFQELASSSLSTCRKGALALIRILLQSSSCQEAFTRAGGIGTLGKVTLMDESIECITEAVVSLSLLTANTKLRSSALESLELDKIISFMDEKFPAECREAAGSIAVLLLGDESSPSLSKQSLKLLANVVQNGENLTVKKRAGKLLLMYATTSSSEGVSRMVSLRVFIELAGGAKDAYKDLLLRFISGFSKSQSIFESGGIPVLLNAFTTKEYQRDAAAAVRALVNTVPSCHETLLAAGFGETGLVFLQSESDDSSCIADTSASLVSVYSSRKQDVLFPELIRALLKLMKNSSSLDVISSAACSIFQLLPLDNECMLLLKKADLMKPLLQLLQCGPKLEALELIVIAIEDASARGELCREGGIPKLIQCLGLKNHRAQELASSILLTLGKPNDSIPDYRLDEIRRSMISSGIIANLLMILQEPKHIAVMNSACLIRNLGYSGQNAAAEEVFTVLFDLLRFYTNNSSTEGFSERLKYVFLALQPFFGDRRLKLLVHRSLAVILQSLSVGYGDSDEDIKHCALNLLLELVEEASMSKEVGRTLVINSVSHLKNIMQNVNNIKCKKLACLLMKEVIKSGSDQGGRQQACKAMRERDCINTLFYLKQFPGCSKEANEVLEMMKKHDKASKICISAAEASYVPWARTNSANF